MKKRYAMERYELYRALHKAVAKAAGCDWDTASCYLCPVKYWIGTARASGCQEMAMRRMTGSQVAAVARRLVRCESNHCDYAIAIDEVRKYVDDLLRRQGRL